MLEQTTPEMGYSPPAPQPNLTDALEVLEFRLSKGWDVISMAEKNGESTESLLAHFLNLLKQYESTFDELHHTTRLG